MVNLLVLGLPVLLTLSQVLLKLGALRFGDKSIIRQYVNPYVIIAYTIYFLITLFNVKLFSILPLKVANLIIAVTYILVPISGRIIFKEKFSRKRVIGIFITVLGLFFYVIGM